jgi:hypothetical protein
MGKQIELEEKYIKTKKNFSKKKEGKNKNSTYGVDVAQGGMRGG